METSYFAKFNDEKLGVSISRVTPKWSNITQEYKALAPSWNLVSDYKSGKIDKDGYTKRYYEETLSKLDSKTVYNYLKDKVLLCYEKPSDFCHRHLVASWIESELGIKVYEI